MILSSTTRDPMDPCTTGVFDVEQLVMEGTVDALPVFSHLTAGGTVSGTLLLESGEIAPTYGERSIGVVHSSLCVRGRGAQFEIAALDAIGRALLDRLDLGVSGIAITSRSLTRIAGTVEVGRGRATLGERLAATGHAAVLRAVLRLCGAPARATGMPLGLYGCCGYDFARQLETLPPARADIQQDSDYVFYLPTRLFVIDYVTQHTVLIVAVPSAADADQCTAVHAHLAEMRAAVEVKSAGTLAAAHVGDFDSDVTQDEFESQVRSLQEAITEGRIFQAVIGRTLSATFSGSPLAVYRTLRRTNPSPYLFYMRDDRGVLLGASPEMAVRVARDGARRIVELKPIAGTAPRGLVNGRIDPALDERYEIALKVDRKELAEHAMLVDLARNDIAAISRPGTTRVPESFIIEKYSRVQHLVSRVQGELLGGYDALDAYLATMNMGTLTGAPKPEAMRLIAETESTARGFFGGGIGFLTADGELETAIVIRSMRMLDGRVYIRAGAGIVADSSPTSEWAETGYKAQACIDALKEAGHAPDSDHR